MGELEKGHMMSMPTRFDGYVERLARVSSTCLVVAARNYYSYSCEWATTLPTCLVVQRNNIHIAVCNVGGVGNTFKALRASPATTKAKAKFILAR